ncbi:MAG TPA: hypothetical protein VGN00_12645 [Puia sp.]|jgi:hypothetical protein
MTKIKMHLLLVALLGIGAAWVNRPPQTSSIIHKYSFSQMSSDRSKWYYIYDLTAGNYVQGIDYDCYPANFYCSFMANPSNSHVDGIGTFFYATDVLASGTDDEGYFINYR